MLFLPSIGEGITFTNDEGADLTAEELPAWLACSQSLYWAQEGGVNCSGLELLYFYHSDYLGSVEFVTDMRGEAYQFFLNTPWGENVENQFARNYTAFSSRFRFNGKEWDEETGNFYYGARYYDPKISVWLSVDPLASEYPSLSSYNYVANSPLNAVDPDGRKIQWSNNKQTIALRNAVEGMAKSNRWFGYVYSYLVTMDKTITVDAGPDAQKTISQKEQSYQSNNTMVIKDIKGFASMSNGNILMDNYDDRTIFEEFYHSFQVNYGQNSMELRSSAEDIPTASNLEAEVRLVLYLYAPELLSNSEYSLLSSLYSQDFAKRDFDMSLLTYQNEFCLDNQGKYGPNSSYSIFGHFTRPFTYNKLMDMYRVDLMLSEDPDISMLKVYDPGYNGDVPDTFLR